MGYPRSTRTMAEVIRKCDDEPSKWCLYAKSTGKRLGGPYDTRDEAVERERQVQFFKHQESYIPQVGEIVWAVVGYPGQATQGTVRSVTNIDNKPGNTYVDLMVGGTAHHVPANLVFKQRPRQVEKTDRYGVVTVWESGRLSEDGMTAQEYLAWAYLERPREYQGEIALQRGWVTSYERHPREWWTTMGSDAASFMTSRRAEEAHWYAMDTRGQTISRVRAGTEPEARQSFYERMSPTQYGNWQAGGFRLELFESPRPSTRVDGMAHRTLRVGDVVMPSTRVDGPRPTRAAPSNTITPADPAFWPTLTIWHDSLRTIQVQWGMDGSVTTARYWTPIAGSGLLVQFPDRSQDTIPASQISKVVLIETSPMRGSPSVYGIEQRQALCQAVGITLDGMPATISGADNSFVGTVCPAGGGGRCYDWAWATIDRVVHDQGGRFMGSVRGYKEAFSLADIRPGMRIMTIGQDMMVVWAVQPPDTLIAYFRSDPGGMKFEVPLSSVAEVLDLDVARETISSDDYDRIGDTSDKELVQQFEPVTDDAGQFPPKEEEENEEATTCVCPSCGARLEREPDATPCSELKCPKCGTPMMAEGQGQGQEEAMRWARSDPRHLQAHIHRCHGCGKTLRMPDSRAGGRNRPPPGWAWYVERGTFQHKYCDECIAAGRTKGVRMAPYKYYEKPYGRYREAVSSELLLYVLGLHDGPISAGQAWQTLYDTQHLPANVGEAEVQSGLQALERQGLLIQDPVGFFSTPEAHKAYYYGSMRHRETHRTREAWPYCVTIVRQGGGFTVRVPGEGERSYSPAEAQAGLMWADQLIHDDGVGLCLGSEGAYRALVDAAFCEARSVHATTYHPAFGAMTAEQYFGQSIAAPDVQFFLEWVKERIGYLPEMTSSKWSNFMFQYEAEVARPMRLASDRSLRATWHVHEKRGGYGGSEFVVWYETRGYPYDRREYRPGEEELALSYIEDLKGQGHVMAQRDSTPMDYAELLDQRTFWAFGEGRRTRENGQMVDVRFMLGKAPSIGDRVIYGPPPSPGFQVRADEIATVVEVNASHGVWYATIEFDPSTGKAPRKWQVADLTVLATMRQPVGTIQRSDRVLVHLPGQGLREARVVGRVGRGRYITVRMADGGIKAVRPDRVHPAVTRPVFTQAAHIPAQVGQRTHKTGRRFSEQAVNPYYYIMEEMSPNLRYTHVVKFEHMGQMYTGNSGNSFEELIQWCEREVAAGKSSGFEVIREALAADRLAYRRAREAAGGLTVDEWLAQRPDINAFNRNRFLNHMDFYGMGRNVMPKEQWDYEYQKFVDAGLATEARTREAEWMTFAEWFPTVGLAPGEPELFRDWLRDKKHQDPETFANNAQGWIVLLNQFYQQENIRSVRIRKDTRRRPRAVKTPTLRESFLQFTQTSPDEWQATHESLQYVVYRAMRQAGTWGVEILDSLGGIVDQIKGLGSYGSAAGWAESKAMGILAAREVARRSFARPGGAGGTARERPHRRVEHHTLGDHTANQSLTNRRTTWQRQ